MLTVTRLARRCGLSRSTVLYYESVGLLRASARSPGNYREVQREGRRATASNLRLPARGPEPGRHSVGPGRGVQQGRSRPRAAARRAGPRDRSAARSSARDPQAARPQELQEESDGHEGEVGGDHEGVRVHRGADARLARRVRAGRARRASGVPRIPAHPGGGDSAHPRVFEEGEVSTPGVISRLEITPGMFVSFLPPWRSSTGVSTAASATRVSRRR